MKLSKDNESSCVLAFSGKQVQFFTSSFRFFKHYLGVRIYIVFLISFLAGVLESVGFVFLLPYVVNSSHAEFGEGVLGRAILSLHNFFLGEQSIEFLWIVPVVILVFIIIIKSCLLYFSHAYAADKRSYLLRVLRKELLGSFAASQNSFRSAISDAEFTSLISLQIDNTVSSFKHLNLLLVSLSLALVYIAFAAYEDFIIVLAGILLFFPYVIYLKLVNRKVVFLSREYVQATSKMLAGVTAAKTAVDYLNITGLDDQVSGVSSNEFVRLSQIHRDQARLVALVNSSREPVVLIILAASLASSLWVSGFEPSSALAIIYLFYRAFSSLVVVQNSIQSLFEHSASVQTVKESLRTLRENEVSRPIRSLDASDGIVYQADGVEFVRGSNPIFSDASFKINKGEIVTITGASGSGKSSLFLMFFGLIPPIKGSFLLWGKTPHEISFEALRGVVGYVPQFPIFFGSTLRDILTWGMGDELDGKKTKYLFQLVDDLALKDLINKESDLDLDVGSNGAALSGGQRQRIALIRELLREPEMLFLDEPTSALDSESERSVNKLLDRISGGVTIIIITHKKILDFNVDQTICLDRNRLTVSTRS